MAYTVLVVDDESELRFLTRVALETHGYRVEEASNGAQALARMARAMPDIVVTDLMMPRMGGRELIGELRANPSYEAIPIIVVSASIQEPIPGATTWISKPFSIFELIEIIHRFAGTREVQR